MSKMNLLKAKHYSDAAKIIQVIKTRLETRKGTKWTLTDVQTEWIKKQLYEYVDQCHHNNVNVTSGKIMLMCSIRFYPEDQSVRINLPYNNAEGTGSSKNEPIIINKPSDYVMQNKIIKIKCKNMSMGDCETNDGSASCFDEYIGETDIKANINK